MTRECAKCEFYDGGKIGMCWRFPATVRVAAAHWCGEFSEKTVAPQTPDEKRKRKTALQRSRRAALRSLAASTEDGDKLGRDGAGNVLAHRDPDYSGLL